MSISRKQKYANETKQALIAASRRLFSREGYAQISLDAIAQAEGLTKGAVYHHFKNKEEIFEAVLVTILEEAVHKIEQDVGLMNDHTQKASRAIDLFLEICLSVDYQRIVLRDGPSVLGWEKWKALEKQYTYPFVEGLVRELQGAQANSLSGEIPTRLIIACVIEIAFMVMEADSKQDVREKAKRFLLHILASMRDDF